MKRLRLFVIPLVAAMALSGCAIKKPNDYVLPGGVATGSDGYQVSAEFANVENLVPNSRVMYNDVVIGTVTRIAMKNWHADVTMKLKKNVPLPATTQFKIGQASLLGAEYVEVVAPSSTDAGTSRLQAGDRVTAARTGNYPETEDVLASVSLVLNGGGLSQLHTITSELNSMVGSPERQQNARELIDRTNVFLASLNQNKKNIIGLIASINRLAGTLARQRATVSRAIQHITPGLVVLNHERATLVGALEKLGEFGTIGSRVIRESGDELVTNLRQLEPTLTKIRVAASSIPNALEVTGTFPFPLPTIAGAVKGDFANLYGTLDLSLPQLTANFIGGPADSSGFNKPSLFFEHINPFKPASGTVPPAGSSGTTTSSGTGTTTKAGSTSGSPATSGTPSAPTGGSSGTPTAPPKACNLLTKLLGGC